MNEVSGDPIETERNPNTEAETLTPYHKDIPLSRLLELRKKKLSYQDIGDLCGCSKVNVWERLQPYIDEIESLDSYKSNRADLLAIVQHRLVNTLNPSTIEKMSPRDRVLAYGILYDKERLERGQSTQNVETHHKYIIDHISQGNWVKAQDVVDDNDKDIPIPPTR